MWQVLPMCNNISQRPLSWIIFVIVFGIVATNNAKSFEALDFGETFVATSDLTAELEHLMQFKSLSSNSNNKTSTSNYKTIKNLTSLAYTATGRASVSKQLLSRHKRFLAFPLGSSFSGAICLTTGVIGNPNYQYLSMGLNWGFAYDLPNITWVLHHIHTLERKNDEKDLEKVDKTIIKRRHRRDIYNKMETIMNSTAVSHALDTNSQQQNAILPAANSCNIQSHYHTDNNQPASKAASEISLQQSQIAT